MFKPFSSLISSALLLLITQLSFAHFQMIYTPEFLLDKGGPLVLKMPFTHPGSNGTMMAIGSPEAFYRISPKGKEDLKGALKEISWGSNENTAKAYEATVIHRAMGDYAYIFIQAPYYDATEDSYIQQFTKLILNVGGLPTHWGDVYNLPIEIIPMQMPYKIYVGGTFSGQVVQNGKPLAHADIEVEFLNYQPNMQANTFAKKATYHYPSKHFTSISLKADQNGVFTFGVPREGIWGFTGVAPVTYKTFQGKELSQEAVLWVQAKAFK